MRSLDLAPASSIAHLIRQRCRNGLQTGPTADLAPGHIQANLLVLPSAYASDFRGLCFRNPVACPLLATSSSPGDPKSIDTCNIILSEFDVRLDLPRYNVYRNGELIIQNKTDILSEWTNDHVAFLIGCSFSFESALARAGLVPRHWEMKRNVSMYKTTKRLNPVGVFTDATYVVSMRPYKPADVEQVRDITRPYLGMHGEPIDWGWEAVDRLGIKDIKSPEFGEAVEFKEGEIPVFWGCGVTPQVAVTAAGDKIQGTVMAHAPGHMMILDMREDDMFSRNSGVKVART